MIRSENKLILLLLCLLILTNILLQTVSVAAELIPTESASPAQKQLSIFVRNMNNHLENSGESRINSLFELYPSFAVMGITSIDNSSIPESVEITAYMSNDALTEFILRVSDLTRFGKIAAASVASLSSSFLPDEALKKPFEIVERIKKDATKSFEEPVTELPGEKTRLYFSYYPDQYHDGNDWIQLTVIFPTTGYSDMAGIVFFDDQPQSSTHTYDEYMNPDYDGYWADDPFSHYEIFTTATPEPDSAAAEHSEKNQRTE